MNTGPPLRSASFGVATRPTLQSPYLRPEHLEGVRASISGAAPDERDRHEETNRVKRPTGPIARLAATALLVGIAAVGCAGHDGPGHAGSIPAQPSPAVAAPANASTPIVTVTDTPATSGPAAAGQSPASGLTNAPAATPDPLDGQLSDINNLINGVNGSLSGADAGTSGGE